MRTMCWMMTVGMALSFWGCAPERPSEVEQGAQASRQEDTRVLANIDGRALTLEDFERRVEAWPSFVQARYVGSSQRRDVLASMVLFEMMALEGQREQMSSNPLVLQSIHSELARQELDARVERALKGWRPSKEDVAREYEATKATFAQPATRQVALFSYPDKQTLEQWLGGLPAQASEARTRAFRLLAFEHSSHPSKSQGGDLGRVKRALDTYPDAFEDRMFELQQVHELSPLFEAQGQWHAMILLDKSQARVQPLDEVEGRVRETLLERARARARQDAIAQLKQGAKVTRDDALFDAITPPDADSSPDPSTTP